MKSKILLKILMPFFFLLTAFTVVGQTLNVSSSSLSGVSTTYGTASGHQSIDVDGSALTSDLVITVSNSAFEISSDGGATYGASVNLGSGNVASTNIRVRLKATAGVAGSPYSGVILTVASSGATPASVDVSIANSTVAQKALTVTADNISKVYGATLTSGTGKTTFNSSGLQNGETIGSVTLTYGTGGAATDPVAVNSGTNVPTAATGGTFNAANYSITYVKGNITVTQAALTVTADNISKVYGATLTSGTGKTTFTYSGLQN